jgi:hypothetical protein
MNLPKHTPSPSAFGFLPKLLLCTAVFALRPASLLACAACYGQSDSPMAQGMNWGILSLLGMIAMVLGGVAGFFVYLARKSAALSRLPAAEPLLESTNRA